MIPNSPKKLGPVILIALFAVGASKSFGATDVAACRRAVVAENQGWTEIRRAMNGHEGIAVSKFGTVLYHTPVANPLKGFEEIDSGTQAVVLMFGGSGSPKSGRVFMLNANYLRKYRIALVSLDHPFHGLGPTDRKFDKAENFFATVSAAAKYFRKTGLPVIMVGHSFGSGVVQEQLYRSPRSVDGAMLFSPGGTLTSALAKRFETIRRSGELETYLSSQTEGELARNFPGEWWADRIIAQMRSYDARNLAPNLEVEVVGGTDDPYGTTAEYAAAAANYTNGTFVPLEGGGHNVFDLVNPDGTRVFDERIVAFLRRITGNDFKKDSARENPALEELRYYYANSIIFREWLGDRPLSFYARDERATAHIMKDWSRAIAARAQQAARELFDPKKHRNAYPKVAALLNVDAEKLTSTDVRILAAFLAEN